MANAKKKKKRKRGGGMISGIIVACILLMLNLNFIMGNGANFEGMLIQVTITRKYWANIIQREVPLNQFRDYY
jgi:hypothetical protein